jgi:uncharacterized membrane-anchored protein
VVAGAICVVILAGMIVGHAWPLWTGQGAILRVVPVDPRDMFRGEYVRLSTPASTLHVDPEGRAQRGGAVTVRPVGDWWPEGYQDSSSRALRGRVVYVQLERGADGVEYRPVTISRSAVRGALNLKGRVQWHSDARTLRVDYGIDRFFMQEGTAKPVEEAVRGGRVVQMDVAIARNGRARIRNLVIDGTPLQRH